MKKLYLFCLTALCYILGIPMFFVGGFCAVCHEAFGQGFSTMKTYLKNLDF